MGIKDWRARHSMRDPIRGEFKVTGRYFAHPGSNSYREVLTGVVSAPGIPPTPGEHLTDTAGRWVNHEVLPVLVDRGEPARFVILWDEVPKPDWRADARREAAQAADQMRSASSAGASSAGATAQAAAPLPEGAQAPDWVRGMLASLGSQMPQGTGHPVIIDGGTEVIDLTAGHLSAADAGRLMATGEPATAVLTGIAEVPVPQAALPGPTASLCDLSLEVTRPDGQTYQARTRLGFRDAQRRAAVTAPGMVLPVRIDPVDPSRVAIDVPAFDARHPGG
jgi:hypothetical protein